MESPKGFDYAFVDRSACGDVINRLESPSTLEILQTAGNECYTARQISAPGNSFDFRRQGNQRLSLIQSQVTNVYRLNRITLVILYNTCLWSKADMVMQEASAFSVMQATRTDKDGDLSVYGPCACRGANWTIDRIQTEVKSCIRARAPEEGKGPEDGDELEA